MLTLPPPLQTRLFKLDWLLGLFYCVYDTLSKRKYKTIQQDKMRGFGTSFLANFLQDYFHNLKKAKEQESRFKKIEGFSRVERDSLTKRAEIVTNPVETAMAGNVSKKLRLD
jgi:hypothetical protein